MSAINNYLEFVIECAQCRKRMVVHAPDSETAFSDGIAHGWIKAKVPPSGQRVWMQCGDCKPKTITLAELRTAVAATGSYFFDRATMRMFGDTMRNYGVRAVEVREQNGDAVVPCWELYRKRPVKHGLMSAYYFEQGTFRQVWGSEK